jgi:hypothetical protein
VTDAELYRRGMRTLVASWEEYARGAHDASVVRAPGVIAAVFAAEPERAVYNNALPAARAGIDAMEDIYAAAGVARFTAWAHESDAPLRHELERRGYTLDECTRAMGMALDAIPVPRPHVDLALVRLRDLGRIVEYVPKTA